MNDSLSDLLAHFKAIEERRRGPIIPSIPPEERVVMFIDMLGFSDLTEKYPIDVGTLTAHARPLSGEFGAILGQPRNPLTDAFHGFHYALRWAIDLAKMRHSVTAITFSDSAFIACEHLHDAVTIASDFLFSMLTQKIPVRAGIAFGTFAALRFRSDVRADGGDHSSEFLGTAVVRAHQTERCGINGLRAFLHPSTHDLLKDPVHNPREEARGPGSIRVIEVPIVERGGNKLGVCYEADYWDSSVTKEASAWRGLQDMWEGAPASVHEHYQATAEAINRMRMAHGEAPLPTFRRRTLPRRK